LPLESPEASRSPPILYNCNKEKAIRTKDDLFSNLTIFTFCLALPDLKIIRLITAEFSTKINIQAPTIASRAAGKQGKEKDVLGN
jgi:hypothetical protein